MDDITFPTAPIVDHEIHRRIVIAVVWNPTEDIFTEWVRNSWNMQPTADDMFWDYGYGSWTSIVDGDLFDGTYGNPFGDDCSVEFIDNLHDWINDNQFDIVMNFARAAKCRWHMSWDYANRNNPLYSDKPIRPVGRL